MSSLTISLIVFLCVISSALLGVFLSPRLPVSHRSEEAKDVVRLGMGLVSTTVAVALGLLISSAKGFYDTQNSEVTQLAANYILLDQILTFYGPEAAGARAALREGLSNAMDYDGSSPDFNTSDSSYANIKSGEFLGKKVVLEIQGLSPRDENQKSLKAQAESMLFQLDQTRWLIFEQNVVPVPSLLLYMLVGWLIVLFLSFGIFAPRNVTVLIGLFLAASAVCGAILLILEMYHPQLGLIRISNAPLRAALERIGH